MYCVEIATKCQSTLLTWHLPTYLCFNGRVLAGPGLTSFPQFSFCTCFRRESLGISGTDFSQARYSGNRIHFPSLSSPANSLFGHVTRMNELAHANWILFAQLPDNWRRPSGMPRSTWMWNVCNNLSSFGMVLPEAREAAQNLHLVHMLTKHSATHLYIEWQWRNFFIS